MRTNFGGQRGNDTLEFLHSRCFKIEVINLSTEKDLFILKPISIQIVFVSRWIKYKFHYVRLGELEPEPSISRVSL